MTYVFEAGRKQALDGGPAANGKIWTVEMEAVFADANAALLNAFFFNRQITDGRATMDLV